MKPLNYFGTPLVVGTGMAGSLAARQPGLPGQRHVLGEEPLHPLNITAEVADPLAKLASTSVGYLVIAPRWTGLLGDQVDWIAPASSSARRTL